MRRGRPGGHGWDDAARARDQRPHGRAVAARRPSGSAMRRTRLPAPWSSPRGSGAWPRAGRTGLPSAGRARSRRWPRTAARTAPKPITSALSCRRRLDRSRQLAAEPGAMARAGHRAHLGRVAAHGLRPLPRPVRCRSHGLAPTRPTQLLRRAPGVRARALRSATTRNSARVSPTATSSRSNALGFALEVDGAHRLAGLQQRDHHLRARARHVGMVVGIPARRRPPPAARACAAPGRSRRRPVPGRVPRCGGPRPARPAQRPISTPRRRAPPPPRRCGSCARGWRRPPPASGSRHPACPPARRATAETSAIMLRPALALRLRLAQRLVRARDARACGRTPAPPAPAPPAGAEPLPPPARGSAISSRRSAELVERAAGTRPAPVVGAGPQQEAATPAAVEHADGQREAQQARALTRRRLRLAGPRPAAALGLAAREARQQADSAASCTRRASSDGDARRPAPARPPTHPPARPGAAAGARPSERSARSLMPRPRDTGARCPPVRPRHADRAKPACSMSAREGRRLREARHRRRQVRVGRGVAADDAPDEREHRAEVAAGRHAPAARGASRTPGRPAGRPASARGAPRAAPAAGRRRCGSRTPTSAPSNQASRSGSRSASPPQQAAAGGQACARAACARRAPASARQVHADAARRFVAPQGLDQQVRGARAEVQHAGRPAAASSRSTAARRQRTSMPADSRRFSRS